MWDYSKLRGRIKEKYMSENSFSESLNMDRSTLSFKLNQKTEFRQSEIMSVIKSLDLNIADIPVYFFKEKVEKTQQKYKG